MSFRVIQTPLSKIIRRAVIGGPSQGYLSSPVCLTFEGILTSSLPSLACHLGNMIRSLICLVDEERSVDLSTGAASGLVAMEVEIP
jgi:hypothetical protein